MNLDRTSVKEFRSWLKTHAGNNGYVNYSAWGVIRAKDKNEMDILKEKYSFVGTFVNWIPELEGRHLQFEINDKNIDQWEKVTNEIPGPHEIVLILDEVRPMAMTFNETDGWIFHHLFVNNNKLVEVQTEPNGIIKRPNPGESYLVNRPEDHGLIFGIKKDGKNLRVSPMSWGDSAKSALFSVLREIAAEWPSTEKVINDFFLIEEQISNNDHSYATNKGRGHLFEDIWAWGEIWMLGRDPLIVKQEWVDLSLEYDRCRTNKKIRGLQDMDFDAQFRRIKKKTWVDSPTKGDLINSKQG